MLIQVTDIIPYVENDQILGILEVKHSEDEENIQNLINQRNQARDEKNGMKLILSENS